MQLTNTKNRIQKIGLVTGPTLGLAALCITTSAFAGYDASYADETFHIAFNTSETISGTAYTTRLGDQIDLTGGGSRLIQPNDSLIVHFGTGALIHASDSYILSAAVSGTGNIDLVNDATLISTADGDTAIYAEAQAGNVSINNLENGNIIGDRGSAAIWTVVGSGSTSVVNSGLLEGSDSGAVYMGGTSGDIAFTNTGITTGYSISAGYGVVNAHTGGKVTIDNSGGTIQSLAGSGATGILIGSNVTGGTITNVGGTIDVGTAGKAIDVQGRNVDVNLRGSGAITGSIALAGGNRNNRLLLDSNGVTINGGVTLGIGNSMEMKFLSAHPMLPFLSATGSVNLTGGNLNIDLSGMDLEVGDSYFLLYAGGGIEGWLASINGQDVIGELIDPSQIFTVGDYNVSFELANGTNVMMNVLGMIPEPSTYALISGGAALAFCWMVRRRKVRARA